MLNSDLTYTLLEIFLLHNNTFEHDKIIHKFHFFGVYIENFVSQELIASGHKELYYWTSRSDAEVDFILQYQNQIYPVEGKSGMSRNLKSLRSYEARYSPGSIIRLSPRNFVLSGNFINLLIYACFLIERSI